MERRESSVGGNGYFKGPKTEAVNTSSDLKGIFITHQTQTPRCIIKETEVQKTFKPFVKTPEWFRKGIITVVNSTECKVEVSAFQFKFKF